MKYMVRHAFEIDVEDGVSELTEVLAGITVALAAVGDATATLRLTDTQLVVEWEEVVEADPVDKPDAGT